jgi:hypothetical protein
LRLDNGRVDNYRAAVRERGPAGWRGAPNKPGKRMSGG